MAQRMSIKYYSPLDSYYSLRDKHLDCFTKPNWGKHLRGGDKRKGAKKKDSFAISPFPSASMLSESFAPTRLTACQRPAPGGNMRPVRLRALTSNTDGGGGGLFLLEDLDVSDLYQLDNEALHKPSSGNEQENESYLPAIPNKGMSIHPALNLSLRQPSQHGARTIHNCTSPSHLHRPPGRSSKAPDLVMERRGKLSSMEQNRIRNRKVSRLPQDCQKIPRAANHSNVYITMLYLGRGLKVPAQNTEPRDELKVFQQICGAENICVYMGHLTCREQFQFASRRHFGFPFSATIYVNGMAAARISWCCEYRYHSGFQQGKLSCFRVIRVKGGTPCYRCLMTQVYQKYRGDQITEEMYPGIKGDFDVGGSENGVTPRLAQVISEYSSLRNDGVCERDAKITMSDGIPSNSDHEMLKSKETPACPGKDKSNANLHTKLKGGRSSSETMRVNNSSSSLDSDSADWTGRGKRSMRKTLRKTACPRVKRVDNTECKSQISTGNVANTARGLLETQHWKNKANIDQESGDSNDPGRGRSMRKKLRKKKVRRRGARKEAEVKDEELINCVNKDHQKTAQEKEERQENTNDLEDGYVDSVTRNEAVEDGFLRNEAETFDNHPNNVEEEMPIVQETEKGPGGDIQAQNPTIGNEETPIKDRTYVMQQTSINEESADLKGEDVLGRELKVECTEEKIQGGNSESAERPSKKINQKLETHLSKDNQLCKDVELAAWVREKLALVLQRAECIRSEAELSDTSEASKSEEWKDSEEDAKNPTEGQMRIDDEVDEIRQRSPNELMKNEDSVYIDAPLLDGWQDDGVTASSDSAQPTQMKFCNPMTPHPGQTRRNLSETSSWDPWDVAALSSANCLKEGREPGHFSCNGSPLMGNEEVREATFPKQKLKGLGKFDEYHPLQMPPPMFANPSGVIGREESEDKLTSPGKRPNYQPLDHLTPANGPGRKRLPTQCNMEFRDGYINSKPGTCTDEDQSASTEQLLAKPAPKDKEEDETTLIVSPWGQQAEGRLRKQVMDTVTVLKACRSVGQLILRNTGLTDDLLETLVSTLINNSESEVETINLNLNNLGPHSTELLVELLKAKPSVKCLLLYGNKLGDKGIGILMNGFTDLFMAEKAQETRASISVGEQPLPCQKWLQLAELDIGSNQLTNEGLKSVAKFLRLNPPLDYLGLSRNDAVHLTGWCELFDILKDNRDVSHLLLDGNVLGNEGAKYLAEVLRVNGSLCKVELDWNEIGDEGGLALSEALSFNPRRSLMHLSLDGNELSLGVKKELKALLSENKQGRLHTIGHGFSTFKKN